MTDRIVDRYASQPGGTVDTEVIDNGDGTFTDRPLAEPVAPSSKYHRLATRYEILAADGSQLNWGWSHREAAERDVARFPGARIVEHVYETEVTASDRVLIDSGIPKSGWGLIRADARRMLNMARDAGRPSDATRSSVAAYKAGSLTEESFAASRPSGFYPEDRS